MLPMFLAAVDQTIVATALPAIVASTGEVERASWIVVSYLISSTIAAPIYGRLGDQYGRRRLMIVGLCVFVAASLACALCRSIETLTFARVLQGLGGSRSTSSPARMPSGRLITKIDCQPRCSARRPPATGPKAFAEIPTAARYPW